MIDDTELLNLLLEQYFSAIDSVDELNSAIVELARHPLCTALLLANFDRQIDRRNYYWLRLEALGVRDHSIAYQLYQKQKKSSNLDD